MDLRTMASGVGSGAADAIRQGLSCGLQARYFPFITSRMRSKSSREEYSIRILPLPLRSVMVTRTPSARCSSCSAFFDVWVHYADLFGPFRGVNQISNRLLGLANRKRSARNEAHRLIPYGGK